MKKSILGLMLAGAAVVAGCSQSRPVASDYAKFELNGNVSSIRLISYKPSADGTFAEVDSLRDPRGFDYYVEFNENGQVTLNESYGRDGSVARREVNKYDGDRIQEASVFGRDGKLVQRSVYEYAGGVLKTVTEYDADGNMKRTMRYSEGKNDTVIVSQYNEKDSLRSTRKLLYDELGREVLNLSLTLKGDTMSMFRLSYDDLGRLSGMESDNIFFGKINNTIVYGEDGQRSEVTMAGERGSLTNYFSYDVDDKSNWTVRRSLSGADSDTLVRIDVRKIEYR